MSFYGVILIFLQIYGILGLEDLFGGKCVDICGITNQIPEEEEVAIKLLKKRSVNEKEDEEDVDADDYVDENGNGKDTNIDDQHARIVNGYKATNRPWLVFMYTAGGLCGGVLINNLFVLSAAHCYCRFGPDNDPIKCKVVKQGGQETSSPDYDVTKFIDYYIGVNDMNLKEAKTDQRLKFSAEKVWIRDGWVFNKGFSPDLSMAKLSRPVTFKTNVVAPICIPSEQDTMDTIKERNKVYIAGWGAQFSACDTNENGPSPNTMCKFPFEHNGKKYDFCTHDPNPAEMNPICKKFLEWSTMVKIKHKKVNANGHAIPVKINYGQNQHIYCFDTKLGGSHELGWCGTCYRGLDSFNDEGKEGYCNPFDSSRKSLPTETSKPTTVQNWGMCADWCRPGKKQGASDSLMETGLDLLDFDVCKQLGSNLAFDQTREICAGKKKHFPIIDIFEMKDSCINRRKTKRAKKHRAKKRRGKKHRAKKRRGKKHRAKRFAGGGSSQLDIRDCFKKSNVAKPETYDYGIKTPFNFYLGGQDSCQGDSGGPLITFRRVNGTVKAHTIGAVSRGTGCANLNAPGIFSRVSHHLDWIKKIAGEGTCP